jgi:hypothetical protein
LRLGAAAAAAVLLLLVIVDGLVVLSPYTGADALARSCGATAAAAGATAAAWCMHACNQVVRVQRNSIRLRMKHISMCCEWSQTSICAHDSALTQQVLCMWLHIVHTM